MQAKRTPLRALTRFGMGAGVGESASLGDPVEWLRRQVELGPEPVADAPSRLTLEGARARVRRAQIERDEEALGDARREAIQLAVQDGRALLQQRVRSARPFMERWVAFWANHLCVSRTSNLQVGVLAGAYEREAIRPHALGDFADMVLASARHPAMLLYLDNAQSIGPGSQIGRGSARRGRDRGLNENYARELMELHTVGVDASYTQDDVTELARVLTGWTITGVTGRERPPPGRVTVYDEAPGFQFLAAAHQPGAKRVMGVRYGQGGDEEGIQAIRDLCRRPDTAHFVADKLVRHFVADTPPSEDVERVADVFHGTQGDLRAVCHTIIDLDSAWDPAYRKFRTPQDWVVAALRALGADEMGPEIQRVLRELRHPLWSPGAPNGFADTRQVWADPDSLMNRAEFARSLGNATRRLDPTRLSEVIALEPDSPLPALLTDTKVASADRIALALAGPEFQWR